jgi:heme exporter protein A
MMVDVRGLVKSYAGRPSLRGIALQVAAGEIVALVGANGAGKTTLLRILATLTQPSAGSIRIAGMALPAEAAAIRRRIGFVSHQPLLYPELSAVENLRFYGRLYGVPRLTPRIEEALAQAGLAAVGGDLVRTYSRGMQQRLALSRAMLHGPSLLLLDEPYANLDSTAREDLDERLRQFAAGGGCVLLTSHDLDRLGGLADRGAKLVDGSLSPMLERSRMAAGELGPAPRMGAP